MENILDFLVVSALAALVVILWIMIFIIIREIIRGKI